MNSCADVSIDVGEEGEVKKEVFKFNTFFFAPHQQVIMMYRYLFFSIL